MGSCLLRVAWVFRRLDKMVNLRGRYLGANRFTTSSPPWTLRLTRFKLLHSLNIRLQVQEGQVLVLDVTFLVIVVKAVPVYDAGWLVFILHTFSFDYLLNPVIYWVKTGLRHLRPVQNDCVCWLAYFSPLPVLKPPFVTRLLILTVSPFMCFFLNRRHWQQFWHQLASNELFVVCEVRPLVSQFLYGVPAVEVHCVGWLDFVLVQLAWTALVILWTQIRLSSYRCNDWLLVVRLMG